MLRAIVVVVVAVAIATVNADHNRPYYTNGRTTMVHLFEWKWNDIAVECERFLGPKGYGGVQVSPITENIRLEARLWYERYQPVSYKWDTRSGNEQEFRSMVSRCNKVGVRIYVDILLNHMSANHKNCVGTAGTRCDSATMNYPGVAYRREHFHAPCKIDNRYADPNNYRNCQLEGLHDLDQSQEHVRGKLVELMNRAIDAGVAGFRIDSARQIWPRDLGVIYSRLKRLRTDHGFPPNAEPYIYHEIIDYDKGNIEKEYLHLGAVTEFKFGRRVSRVLRGQGAFRDLHEFEQKWGTPSRAALTFIDNHDSQRQKGGIPLTYKDGKSYKQAVTFMLAHPYGRAQIMSSFDFNSDGQGPPADYRGNIVSPNIKPDGTCGNGWICEHRWPVVYRMVKFRNFVAHSPTTNWWDNGHAQAAFCRGNKGFFAINGDRADLRQKLHTCLPPGVYCDVVSGRLDKKSRKCTGRSVRVDNGGLADIDIRGNDSHGVLALAAYAKAA